MKKRSKILAVLLTAALSMSLAACGKGSGDNQTAGNAPAAETQEDASDASGDAEAPREEIDPFEEAQKNMMDIRSLEAVTVMEMDMVVGMNGEEQSLESVTTMEMKCIYDPLVMSLDMTVDAKEAGSQQMTMYFENTEDACMAYLNDGTGWKSQEISVMDIDQYDFSTDMEVYLSGDYGFQAVGMEDVDGASAYKYEGAISGDEMKDLIRSSGALDSVDRLGINTSQIDGMLDELGDLKVDFWIDEATLYPAKYEIDMTEPMDMLMGKLVEAMGEQGEGLSMSIPKMVISLTCKNYNAVAEFSVPEEAKAE